MKQIMYKLIKYMLRILKLCKEQINIKIILNDNKNKGKWYRID